MNTHQPSFFDEAARMAKLTQYGLGPKDGDARWTKKKQETFYGYKNHIRTDADSVITSDCRVTTTAVHGSPPVPELIGPQNKVDNLFADSAYQGAKTAERLEQLGITNYIHEKVAVNVLQKESNRLKSQVRCHLEPIFGYGENSRGRLELDYIGLPRIRTGIGLSNPAYNLLRRVQLIRLKRTPGRVRVPALHRINIA